MNSFNTFITFVILASVTLAFILTPIARMIQADMLWIKPLFRKKITWVLIGVAFIFYCVYSAIPR